MALANYFEDPAPTTQHPLSVCVHPLRPGWVLLAIIPLFAIAQCEVDDDEDGYSVEAGDCDDNDPAVYPGATENCDDVDQDCNGIVDDQTECYDDDGDGYSDENGDCDDQNSYTYPGAPERPDFLDNDCDGQLEGPLTLASAHVQLEGDLTNGSVGSALSHALGPDGSKWDLNGDGYDDLVIGASSYDAVYQGQYRGSAFVLFGQGSGWNELDHASLRDNSTLLYAEDSGENAGYSVALAGDLNDDGFGDFAVGAPQYAPAGRYDVGRVYLVFGKAEGWGETTLLSASFATLTGFSEYDRVGYSVDGGGDVNGDGLDDLLIGAPNGNMAYKRGMAMVLPGKRAGWSTELHSTSVAKIIGNPDMVLGRSVAILGTTNSDGAADLAIGSLDNIEMENGAATIALGDASLVEGSRLSLDELTAHTYYGSSPDSFTGESLSGRVDVDNDGSMDILVGKRDSYESEHMAYLLFDQEQWPTDYTIDYIASVVFVPGAQGMDECPCKVQGIGDMNGDGLDDFAIGVTGNDENGEDAGMVYVFHGRENREAWGESPDNKPIEISLDDAALKLPGENPGDEAGSALGTADLNGDGWQDLVVSARYYDGEFTDAGKIYVVFGADSSAPTGPQQQ